MNYENQEKIDRNLIESARQLIAQHSQQFQARIEALGSEQSQLQEQIEK